MELPLAALLTLGVTVAARADVTFDLGNALLAGGQSTHATAALTGRCTGIALSVNFAPDAIARAHESFCSDGALFLTPPSGTHTSQWGGSDVWKIGGKVFAIAWDENGKAAFTFKVSDVAFEMLRDEPGLRPAPYLASRGLKWIQHYAKPGLPDAALRWNRSTRWSAK